MGLRFRYRMKERAVNQGFLFAFARSALFLQGFKSSTLNHEPRMPTTHLQPTVGSDFCRFGTLHGKKTPTTCLSEFPM